jgi:hypothetical protein
MLCIATWVTVELSRRANRGIAPHAPRFEAAGARFREPSGLPQWIRSAVSPAVG